MTPPPPDHRILPFPERPEDRLRRALRGLEAALAGQKEAVHGLRTELAALSVAVGGLGASLQEYRQGLDDAALATAAAHAQARSLDATADALLAACHA